MLKSKKCKSLPFCSGQLSNASFKLQDEIIENINNGQFKFLGTQIFRNNQRSKSTNLLKDELISCLQKMNNLLLRGSYKFPSMYHAWFAFHWRSKTYLQTGWKSSVKLPSSSSESGRKFQTQELQVFSVTKGVWTYSSHQICTIRYWKQSIRRGSSTSKSWENWPL